MPTLALTGVSSTGQVALIGAPGLAALAVPAPQFAVSGEGALPLEQLTLPAPVPVIAGLSGSLGFIDLDVPAPELAVYGPTTATLTLPVPVLSIGGDSGIAGAMAFALPAPVVSVAGPDTARIALPSPALQISGGVGVIGRVSLDGPAPAVLMQGQVPYTAREALTLPRPVVSIAGSAGVAGSVVVTMRGIALALEGGTGVIGEASLVLPVSRFSASGYENTTGSVELVLPHLQLMATGSQSAIAPASSAATTLVMHTEQLGLTTYSNYPFNSFAAFNGVYLAASPAGIFTLGGADDNGADIQAAARVGITDFASSYLKRVDRVYVGYRTDGNLVLRIFTDEINQRDYLLTATGKAGLHGNHARLGKGLVARYWQFEVRNQNGADFQLNAIELKPTRLKRRVGGGDA